MDLKKLPSLPGARAGSRFVFPTAALAALTLLALWGTVGCQRSSHLPDRSDGVGESAASAARVSGLRIAEKKLEAHGLKTVWVRQSPDGPIRSAYVVGDDIYAVALPTSASNPKLRMIAYKRSDGLHRWIRTIDQRLRHAPTVYHYPQGVDRKPSEVYITQGDTVVCKDFASGLVLWEVDTDYSISSGICASETHFYVGSYNGKVYGHQKGQGFDDWFFITDGEVSSTGVVNGLNVMFTSMDGNAYRFHVTRGPGYESFYRNGIFRTGAAVVGDVLAHAGRVYVGSRDFKLYCLYENDFSEAWDFQAQAPIEKTPLIGDFRLNRGFTTIVMVITNDERTTVNRTTLWAVNAANGRRLWNFQHVDDVVATTPNAIYVTLDPRADRGERVVALDPASGEERFSLDISGFDLVPSSVQAPGKDRGHKARIILIDKETGFMQAIGERF